MSNDELTFEYRDEFKRRAIGEKIVNLLMDDEFSPMVLDGDWGVGKTEFCHKLINLIRADQSKEGGTNKNIPRCQCLYIDAFAEDHGDDPLLMLLGNIACFIKDKEGNGDRSECYQKWKNASIAVAKSCFKIVAKASIGLLLKQNADSIGDEISDAITKSAEEGVDAIVNAFLQQYEESNSNIETLKSILAELARDERMIIVVDELDRCRPDFSITLLEKIKHVFNVPNVSFLLVANMKQLSASVSHVYGEYVDSNRYLNKFLKLSVSLVPSLNIKNDLFFYFEYLVEKDVELSFFAGNYIGISVSYLLRRNNHTLRDVEQFVRYLKVSVKMSRYKKLIEFPEAFVLLFVIVVYCYCFKRNIAYLILANDVSADVIVNELKANDEMSFRKMSFLRNMLECLDRKYDENNYINKQKIDDLIKQFSGVFCDDLACIRKLARSFVEDMGFVKSV